MKYKFVSLEQGSPEWLAYRKNGIGASEIPAICNVRGSYQTADQVLDSKFGIEKTISDYTAKIFAEGHELEEQVRAEAFENLGKQYRPAVVESIEHPMFFASLDGISENNDAIIEVKSTRKADFLRQVQDGFCPDIYFYQIQWQLYITGLKECTLVVVDAETKNKYPIIVDRDDSIIETLVGEALKFYERMKSGVAPTQQLDAFDEIGMRLEAVLHSIEVYNERIKELEDKKKEYASFLLIKYAAKKLENDRLSIQVMERQGSVNYKAIPELRGVNLDQYRGKATTQMRVALKGGKSNE